MAIFGSTLLRRVSQKQRLGFIGRKEAMSNVDRCILFPDRGPMFLSATPEPATPPLLIKPSFPRQEPRAKWAQAFVERQNALIVCLGPVRSSDSASKGMHCILFRSSHICTECPPLFVPHSRTNNKNNKRCPTWAEKPSFPKKYKGQLGYDLGDFVTVH